ncbi:unnamed protein product, partial [Polarella glacialis]
MSAWDMPMKLVMDEGDRLWPTQSEVPTSSTKAPSSSAVPRRGFGATSTTAGSFVGRRAGLREDRDSVVEDEDPDTGNLELPKASGHLSAVLARAALEELNRAESAEQCAQCAAWLGHALNYTIQNRDADLVAGSQSGLVLAAQRHASDERSLKQVLMSLARIAGPEFPFMDFFLVLEGGKTLEPQALGPAVAETWTWLLTEGGARGKMVIKVAFKNSSQGSERLKKLVDFTFDLLRQCSSKAQKDVARHCCTSLGALGWIVKDELVLVKKIADWLLDTVESFVGYPEVVHEGLVALVELCKERMEIFGIDVSRHEPGQDGQEATSFTEEVSGGQKKWRAASDSYSEGPGSHCEGSHGQKSLQRRALEDTIAHHLRDKALGLAYTCEARSDFSDDTLNQVYKLLAHTHPLEEVVRFIVANAQAGKNRSWKGMLWSVLDEINDSLSPHITSWTKAAASRKQVSAGKVQDA